MDGGYILVCTETEEPFCGYSGGTLRFGYMGEPWVFGTLAEAERAANLFREISYGKVDCEPVAEEVYYGETEPPEYWTNCVVCECSLLVEDLYEGGNTCSAQCQRRQDWANQGMTREFFKNPC